MSDQYYQQTLEALRIFYETPNVDEKTRKQIDLFLQNFLQSQISWEISDRILREKNLPLTFYFYAANTLTIRLRSHFDDLPTPAARRSFRDSLINNLSLFFFNSHEISTAFQTPGINLRVVERLATALSILMLHLIAIEEWTGALQDITNLLIPLEIQQNIQSYAYDPQTLSRFLILLRVLTSLPETLEDSRFRFTEKLAGMCDYDAPTKAMLQYKPILLTIVSNLLYITKPVMWQFDKLQNLIVEHEPYNSFLQLSSSDLQSFQSTYSILFQKLTTQQFRNVYKELGEQVLTCVTSWATHRLLSLQDLILFTLTPSNDPNHQNIAFTISPLPNDPSISLVTSPIKTPSSEAYPFSLYTLLITSTLHTPDFTTTTAELLSLLYTNARFVRDYDMVTGELLQDSPEQNLFLRSSSYENCDKPEWFLLFIQHTLINLQSIYQRSYASEDASIGVKLINMYSDFTSLFQKYLRDDPNITANAPGFAMQGINNMFGPLLTGFNDIFSSVLQSLINALQLTYQPYTASSLQESLSTLLTTYNPQNKPENKLFFLFYSFSTQIELEAIEFPHQIITTRKNAFNSSFSIFQDLLHYVLEYKEDLWLELDNIEQSQYSAEQYGASDQIYDLEVQQERISREMDHMTDRINLITTPILQLISIVIISTQYPLDIDDLLSQSSDSDNSASNDYVQYRWECSSLVLELIKFIGKKHSFKVWFQLYEQFQIILASYATIYPYPTNTYGNQNDASAVWSHVKPYTSHHNLSLPSPFQLTQSSTNATQASTLQEFVPFIQLYNPKTTPQGWQPLEHIAWALTILTPTIRECVEDSLNLSNKLFRDKVLSEKYLGCIYSEAQFHLCRFGNQYHPQTPYGEKNFQDSLLLDENDILMFCEQLGNIFEIFITYLHRNVHSFTLNTMLVLIRSYSSFLTLPVCIYKATGYIMDLTTMQPYNASLIQSKQLVFTTNAQILRVLTQILLSFALYSVGLQPFNLNNGPLLQIQNPHTFITSAAQQSPQSLDFFCLSILDVPQYSESKDRGLNRYLDIPETAGATLVFMYNQNSALITRSDGESIFSFLLLLLQRATYNATTLLPQHFLHTIRSLSKNNQIEAPTVAQQEINRHALTPNPWLGSVITPMVMSIFNSLPSEEKYTSVLTLVMNELFELVKQLYTQYVAWIKAGVGGLQLIYQQTNGDISKNSLYAHVLAQFHFISTYFEIQLINRLFCFKLLFANCERPSHLRDASLQLGEYAQLIQNEQQNGNLPSHEDDFFKEKFLHCVNKPRRLLIAQALQHTLPMFEQLIQTFSFSSYTLPSQQSQSNERIPICEHPIVDKVINMWTSGLQQCSLDATDFLIQICTLSCKYFTETQHSSFLYAADGMVRLSTQLEIYHIKQLRSQPNPPLFTTTLRRGAQALPQFNSSKIALEFLDYFSPVVFSLASKTIKAKHPQHLDFDFVQLGYLGTSSFPDLHNPQSTLRASQQHTFEEILATNTRFFPENSTTMRPRNQMDPQDIYKQNPQPTPSPVSIPLLSMLGNKDLYSIHIVTQCFMEYYPEITEDYIGLLNAILFEHAHVLKQSKFFLHIVSFVISALYCSSFPAFDLALRFLRQLYQEFVYKTAKFLDMAPRKRYPSSGCENIQQISARLQYLQQQSGGDLLSNQCSCNELILNEDKMYSEGLCIDSPTHIRYVNILDCYKLNQFDLEAYLLLSLITPSLFAHVFLSCLSFNRSPQTIFRLNSKNQPDGLYEPINLLLNTLAMFMYQNTESLLLFNYTPLLSTQSLNNFSTFFSTFTSEQTALLVHHSVQTPNPMTDPNSLLSPQPSIDITTFSPTIQNQFNYLINPTPQSSQANPTISSSLVNVLLHCLSFATSPYYYTKPQQISNFLDQLSSTPSSQHNTILLSAPDQISSSSPIDNTLQIAILKTFLSLVAMPGERARRILSHDLATLFYSLRGEQRRSRAD